MAPRFFASAAEFRAWLAENHNSVKELLAGFHKKGSGKPSITYPEALDEALCFGWIDGVRKNLNATSYTIRFTPRKPKSNWSMVNIKRMRELIAASRPHAAGLAAFEARDETKSQHYSYEARRRGLGAAYEKKFRAEKKAWAFFAEQAPSYQRTSSWWVMSAKKEETQLKRLDILIAESGKGRRVGAVEGKPASSK